MSRYRNVEMVQVKLIRATSLDELEVMMNQWLSETKREIRDVSYPPQHDAKKEVYTCLITYSPLEYEPPM